MQDEPPTGGFFFARRLRVVLSRAASDHRSRAARANSPAATSHAMAKSALSTAVAQGPLGACAPAPETSAIVPAATCAAS